MNVENTPYPFKTGSITEIRMDSVLEHISIDPRIFFSVLQELYRICADGAVISILCPHPFHRWQIVDFTHQRAIDIEGIEMLSKTYCDELIRTGNAKTPLAYLYDIDFEILDHSVYFDETAKQHIKTLLGEFDPAKLKSYAYLFNNIIGGQQFKLKTIKNNVKAARNTFDDIYLNGGWGSIFSSGPGSHDEPLVAAYVDCITSFLLSQSQNSSTSALDVGCGDFNIGKRLHHLFESYCAIDISDTIIKRNQQYYQGKGLSFETCCGSDPSLEFHNIVFIRQVFQHLSNKEIHLILNNLKNKCNWMIVTEHIPQGSYTPNVEHNTDQRHTRLHVNSGVDVLSPPFNLIPARTLDLMKYPILGGIILTRAHQMRAITS